MDTPGQNAAILEQEPVPETRAASRESVPWRIYALIAAAALAAHFLAFTRGFVWDDVRSIDFMKSEGGLWKLFQADPFGFVRPGKVLMWSVFYTLFGERPLPYLIASMAVVIATGVAYHGLARRWLSPAAATATALIYVIHPFQLEASFWFSSLNGSLLVLLGVIYSRLILSHNEAFTFRWAAPAAALYLAALLLKEEVVVFPIVATIMLLSLGRRPSKAVVANWAALYMVSAVFILFARHTSAEAGQVLDWTIRPSVMALASPRNLLSHFLYFFTPFWWSFGHIYDVRPIIFNSWMITGYVALAASLYWLLRTPGLFKDPARMGFLLFLTAMLPVANIIPLGNTWFAPRYLCNSSIGLMIMAGALMDRHGAFTGGPARVLRIVLGAWIALAAIVSNHFHLSFKSSEVFWLRSVEEAPTNTVFLTGLATIRLNEKKYEEALALAEEAIANGPRYMTSYKIKGICLAALGHEREAIELFHMIERITPDDVNNSIQLAFYYDNQFGKTRDPEDWNKAERYYRIAMAGRTLNSAIAHNNLGLMFISRGDFDQAFAIWIAGAERFPYAKDIAQNLARARRDPRYKPQLERANPPKK